MQPEGHYDLILLGGGLANSLIAWHLAQARPEVTWCLLEQGPMLGGNHTWSFHGTDLTAAQEAWLMPLVAHRWPEQEVRFPTHRRIMNTSYRSVTSDHLHRTLMQHCAGRVHLDCATEMVDARHVRMPDGTLLQAGAVIDGRGPAQSTHIHKAYQKFLGIEIRLATPHGMSHPIIMDATVPQLDGLRFLYVLPLDHERLLVEDTYYSDRPDLDLPMLRQRLEAYAQAQGWQIAETLREERGVLEVILGGDIEAFWREPVRQHPCSGLRAGLTHATTGYSLPEAVRLAEHVATLPEFSAAALRDILAAYATSQWRGQGFYRLLNRMLFFAARPEKRYQVLERFYRLPQPLIERFYAGRLRWRDCLRILVGKPPVRIGAALRSLFLPLSNEPPHVPRIV